MRLLLDTDIFCKLGVAGLLEPALGVLGVGIADCGRLAALPHMLRRGRLVKLYGESACESLVQVADALQVVGPPAVTWLEPLVAVANIDPGEAQIFAVAAENSLVLLSGDKRALRAVCSIEGIVGALAGRVVTLEAILLALCTRLGTEAVRTALEPLVGIDQMVRICFSASNPDPASALESYLAMLKNEVHPLVLWAPPSGGVN